MQTNILEMNREHYSDKFLQNNNTFPLRRKELGEKNPRRGEDRLQQSIINTDEPRPAEAIALHHSNSHYWNIHWQLLQQSSPHCGERRSFLRS